MTFIHRAQAEALVAGAPADPSRARAFRAFRDARQGKEGSLGRIRAVREQTLELEVDAEPLLRLPAPAPGDVAIVGGWQ